MCFEALNLHSLKNLKMKKVSGLLATKEDVRALRERLEEATPIDLPTLTWERDGNCLTITAFLEAQGKDRPIEGAPLDKHERPGQRAHLQETQDVH